MAVQSAVSVIIGAELGGTFKGAFGDAKSQLNTLGNAIKGLDKSSENIKAFVKLKQDTASTKTELKNAEDRLRALSAEMTKTDKPSRELQSNFRTATKEAKTAKQAYDNNAKALRDMGKQLTDAGVNTKNLTAEQSKLGSALETLKKRQTELASVESAKAKNMQTRAGYRAQIMDVVALGTTMYGMIQPAIAFESAMADVKKVVDFDTPMQLREMENDIKNLSKSIPLPLDGLAKIVAAGGQLGVPREELAKFAETAAKMSVAFDITADEAGQAMAKMSNVLQMPISEMGKVGDVINHLSNNIAATAGEIVEANLRAGAMGKSFGLAYNEVSALAGTFIAMGKSPEIAGTAINMMTSRMKLLPVATGAARDAFNQLGISMKDYTAMVESGDGRTAMLTILESLQKLTGVKRSQVMKDIFGEQATRHINSLVEGLDSLKSNLELVSDETGYAESMQREFAARSATTENNIQLLKNQLAILATNVGSTLLPAINSVVGIFGRAANSVADFAEKHPTLIKYLGIAVAGMGAIKIAGFGIGYMFTFLKGGVLTIMGVFSKARTVFSLLRLGFTGLIPIIKAVGTAFISNPIGLIITGIAAGAFLLIKYWEPISEFFKKLFEPVVAAFKSVWEWMTNLWEKAKNIFSGIKEWISDSWVGKAWNWAFGSDDKKSKTETSPQIGSTVSDLVPAASSAVELPRSNVSNSNMSSVQVSAPITINASPGMNEAEIAKQVSRELDSREQSALRQARGVNYD